MAAALELSVIQLNGFRVFDGLIGIIILLPRLVLQLGSNVGIIVEVVFGNVLPVPAADDGTARPAVFAQYLVDGGPLIDVLAFAVDQRVLQTTFRERIGGRDLGLCYGNLLRLVHGSTRISWLWKEI